MWSWCHFIDQYASIRGYEKFYSEYTTIFEPFGNSRRRIECFFGERVGNQGWHQGHVQNAVGMTVLCNRETAHLTA